MAFFNFYIHPTDNGGKAMRPSKEDFRWAPARMGKKAKLLKQIATQLYSTDTVQSIAAIASCSSVGGKRECPPDATPLDAKKSRKLAESPTDASLG